MPLQQPLESSKLKLRPQAWCWSLPKCELVLVAGDASTVDLSAFPASFSVKQAAAFELLGSPVGMLITATLSPSLNELARRQPAWRL